MPLYYVAALITKKGRDALQGRYPLAPDEAKVLEFVQRHNGGILFDQYLKDNRVQWGNVENTLDFLHSEGYISLNISAHVIEPIETEEAIIKAVRSRFNASKQ